MRNVLRSVKKRKKSRCLGEPNVISREEYREFELDARVELIRALVPIGLMHVGEMLDDEVTELAGARYSRKDPSVAGRRHGNTPTCRSASFALRATNGGGGGNRTRVPCF